jgi:hypothetical protein
VIPSAPLNRDLSRIRYGRFETLGNLGDFIGGIAVVVTLVYLAIQVRQNTIALRTASRQEIVRAFRDHNRLTIDHKASAKN